MHAYGEEESHREWNTENVVYACPDEVSAYDGEDGAGEVEGSYDVEEIRTHKDYICSFDSDGCSG